MMILTMITMLTYANPSYCHCSQLCRCLFADLPSEKGQFKVSFSISLKIFTFLGDLCLNISWLGFLVGKVGGWSPWELVGSGTRSVIVWNSRCVDDVYFSTNRESEIVWCKISFGLPWTHSLVGNWGCSQLKKEEDVTKKCFNEQRITCSDQWYW